MSRHLRPLEVKDASRSAALEKLQEHAKKLADFADIFIVIDRAGSILYVNGEGKQQLARVSDAEGRIELGRYCHLDDLDEFVHKLGTCENRFSWDLRLQTQDGNHHWFLLSLTARRFDTVDVWMCVCIDIHERVLAEMRAQQTASIQADMLRVSVDCIKVIAPGGDLLHMNRAGCVALGVEETAFGTPWLELLPEAVRTNGRLAFADACQGRVSRFDGESQRPNAPPQYWDNMLTPVMDEGGVTRSILCVSREVTAQKEVELRLQLAARATSDVIWDWNLLTGEMNFNPALERRFGHLPANVGATLSWWLDAVHPRDRALVREKMKALVEGSHDEYAMEYRFRRADGIYADILDRGYISRNVCGQVVRMVGAMCDQTDRKAIERHLLQLNLALETQARIRSDEFRVLWDCSPDILLLIGRNGVVKRANSAAKEILGFDPEQLIGDHFTRIAPLDQTERFFHLLTANVAQPLEIQYIVNEDAIRWVSWIASPHPKGFIAIGSDITAVKDAQAALLKSESEMAELNGLTELGLLTGSVAHDFNNLLGVIRNWTNLLRKTSPDAPQREKFLDAILNTTDRAANLTARLLTLGRSDSGVCATFDILDNINALQSILATLLGPAINLDVSGPSATYFLEADPYQFDTALINLVINARDAMAGAGSLHIAVTGGVPPPELQNEEGRLTLNFFAVAISDSGCGIPEADLPHIFEPLFTTKARGKGTGLGLSQVARFVRELGGDIDVATQPGIGTTFTLYFPAARLIGLNRTRDDRGPGDQD